MRIEFISSFAAITPDPGASRKLYVDAFGLPLEGAQAHADYLHSENIEGARRFGVEEPWGQTWPGC